MPSLADVFTPDAFNVYSLTAAVNKIPHAPRLIGDMGIFREIPIATTLVAVEESQGKLTLVPTTPRSGPGIPSQDANRIVTSFNVPHIQLDDTVTADDVINVRAFGGEGPAPATEVVARKLEIMRRSVDTTIENLRMHALHGKVFYPDNSHDADLDLFTAFGLTDQATDRLAVDLDVHTAATDVLSETIPLIKDQMEVALGGEPYNGILCIMGRTIFRMLVGHALVRDAYKQQLQQWILANIGQTTDGFHPRMVFQVGDISFVEYYGKVGTSAAGPGGAGEYVLATEGTAIPLGTDLFHTYYAPADTMEAVGTLGLPLYARTVPQVDGKSVGLEVQSNPLSICLRPKVLLRIHGTA